MFEEIARSKFLDGAVATLKNGHKIRYRGERDLPHNGGLRTSRLFVTKEKAEEWVFLDSCQRVTA